jgi:hypothetical protein
MTPEEDAARRETRRLWQEQVWATRWLRTEIEQLERRRAAGGAVDEAALAATRAELVAAEARWAVLDRDVARAGVPELQASLAAVADLQRAAAAVLAVVRERYQHGVPERSAEAEAQFTGLLSTLRAAVDVEREVVAFLARLDDPAEP